MTNGVHVPVHKCAGMREKRHRAPDKWTFSRLSKHYSVSYETVRRHVRGDCCHVTEVRPVPVGSEQGESA